MNDWSQRTSTTHELHLKHRLSSPATEAITRILLFAEGFVSKSSFKINTYCCFTTYHRGGQQSWLYCLEKEIGVQRAYASHAVGISAGTKAQNSWLPGQCSLYPSTLPPGQTRDLGMASVCLDSSSLTAWACLFSIYSPELSKFLKKEEKYPFSTNIWVRFKNGQTVLLSQFLF